MTILKFRKCTQAQYDALQPPRNPAILYFISDRGWFYLGDMKYYSGTSETGLYLKLDANGKVNLAYLYDSVLGQMEYAGTFDPTAGYPTITNALSPNNRAPRKGDYFIATGTGTIEGTEFNNKDWLIKTTDGWQHIDNTDAVASINGKMGVVVLNGTDIQLGGGVTTTIQAKFVAIDQSIADLWSAFASYYTKTQVDAIIEQYYTKEYIDALKDKNGWESELLGTLSNDETIALSIINQYDEIQMYAKDTLGVIDNENIRPSLMESGDSVYFFDDTQAFIMVDTVFGFYAPTEYTLQVVGVKYTDLTAEDTTYNNVTSGLDAENVQEAIDEVFSNIDEIDKNKVEKIETRNVGVETIIYENGKIRGIISPTLNTTLKYDIVGNLIGVIEAYMDGKTYETTYTKDVEGRIKTMTKAEV